LTFLTTNVYLPDSLDFLNHKLLVGMMRKLPPMKSLQTFEAAARCLSFTKAAEELHVTPAAVSQQIKLLEDYLGVSLFQRMTRAVKLTEDARLVLPLMTESFDKLEEAVERLTQDEEAGPLTVNTAPTFAARWLLQRLPDFSEKYPHIDLRLDASLVPREFRRDSIDISIRLCEGDPPGLRATHIFDEEFSPVCSPALINSAKPLRSPEDLKHHRLLHVDWGYLQASMPDWRRWVEAAGIEDINLGNGPCFTVETLAIEAAINGSGIALVSHHAIAEDLNAGRLVRPFDLSLRADFSYWLVCPDENFNRAKVKAFSNWLLEEAAKDAITKIGCPCQIPNTS
jgi:LysR family glycine cleavage system transcriptional activator